MAVPYTFGSATTSIPLSQLDSNFATTITLGNTAVQLGNTITTLTGVTNLASSGALTLGSNGNTTAVYVDTSQNVGIGTSLPSYKLDVNGYASSRGAIGSSYFGYVLWDSTSSAIAGVLQWNPSGSLQLGTNKNYPIDFYTNNNSASMRIDSSGSVIINSTSTGRGDKLTVVGAGTLSTVTSSVRGLLAVESDTATAQNVGGAISLGGNYDGGRTQYAAIGGFKESTTSSEYGGYLAFFTRPNGDVTKERMRINSSGDVIVGTTSLLSAGKLSVSFDGGTRQGMTLRTTIAGTGSTYMQFENSAGGTAGYIIHNGTTTVSYVTSSDYRLKEAITPMTGALAKVARLKPVTYKWKVDGSDGEGFIAHELAEVCPIAVTREKDAVDADGNPVYQGIDTSFLVATLTAALQETKALIDTQAETINALTARIVALESK
jgi:hypothetical protein